MKRSLADYLKKYVDHPIDPTKKRHVYQRVVRHIARHDARRFRVGHFFAKAVFVASLTVVLLIGGFFSRWFFGGEDSVLAPGVSVTYADQIGEIVSVEGYFDIYSQGHKIISEVVHVNDVLSLPQGSEIVMTMGDDLTVVIAGPAKVLVRINPATGKYRLSFLEGDNIIIRSQRAKSAESLGIEVEMKDGSLVVSDPLPVPGSEIVVREDKGTSVVVNRSQQVIHVVRSRSSQTEVIPQSVSRILPSTDAGGQVDFETREIFMQTVGIVEERNGSGASMLSGIIDSGSLSLSGMQQDQMMLAQDGSEPADLVMTQPVSSSPANQQDRQENTFSDGLTQAQRVLVNRWADHQKLRMLVADLVAADISSDDVLGLDAYQTLLTYTMQTYTAYGVVYPGSNYTYADLVRAINFLRHYLRRQSFVADDVLVGVSFVYHMLYERSQRDECNDCYDDLLRRVPARFRIK
ncbi:MAG: hypothetical protein NZL83_03715 [Candidatus Absconditabacterales bacterium]|nr:hypothetical protein [Candidatus Absconditabacterales bacterium]